eukprot:5566856-Prymnesium_polylepis.1
MNAGLPPARVVGGASGRSRFAVEYLFASSACSPVWAGVVGYAHGEHDPSLVIAPTPRPHP